MNSKDCFTEIMTYCKKENNYSYYDMKAYAVKNKPEWIEALKNHNFRVSVSEYLKSAKRKKNIEYKTSMVESFENYIAVELEMEKIQTPNHNG